MLPYASTAVETQTQYALYRDGTPKTPLAVVVEQDGWYSIYIPKMPAHDWGRS
jgi:hypothetical protein